MEMKIEIGPEDPQSSLYSPLRHFHHYPTLAATTSQETKSFQSVYKLIRKRETLTHVTSNTSLAKKFIPNTQGELIQSFPCKVYSGSFSDDGAFYFACTQNFSLHLYDSKDPTSFIPKATIPCRKGRWTITDTTLSPENNFLAYSSITPLVYLTQVNDEAQLNALQLNSERQALNELMSDHLADGRSPSIPSLPPSTLSKHTCLAFSDDPSDDFGVNLFLKSLPNFDKT